MLKKTINFGVKYLPIITLLIVFIELSNIAFKAFNHSFNYLYLVYSLVGLFGAILAFKKSIAGKWLLWVFFGLQVIFIKTLDIEIGFDPSVNFPISFNSNSSENGNLTKLFLFKINFLAIFGIFLTNRFYRKPIEPGSKTKDE